MQLKREQCQCQRSQPPKRFLKKYRLLAVMQGLFGWKGFFVFCSLCFFVFFLCFLSLLSNQTNPPSPIQVDWLFLFDDILESLVSVRQAELLSFVVVEIYIK